MYIYFFIVFSQTCPKNMILFLFDENSTNRICDCLNFYLYYSGSNSCHEPYRQGPCPPENYLVLPPGEILARCEKNPCLEDGLVPFEGSCLRLEEHCGHMEYNKLIVSYLDFRILCTTPIYPHIVDAPGKTCPIGSRRIATGLCKKIL